MARPELGTKRVCPTTGRKFYDLNKDPIISPYTGQVVTIAAPLLRGRPDAVAPRADQTEDDNELDPVTDAELISLEEADDEASAAKAVVGDDDIDVEDDPGSDDTFLEEDEDENDDVTDLIGDGIEDDEES
ncbi:TIGR02300 family protein [Labrys sp. LIt4]|uniref:TIGR02300 family protein n=1 Tax=Labrys okinawensis TaxID=346911 RepID=A0A2S9QG78_9HYPH|nr:TIGR02300 family protein [Labrys okinawensis]MBP0579813.1 TIGR02300 family protein [Labrys sp. LIt4]PRH88366.1 TIGR02300 family protein [Labrys okinawensis]